MEASRGFLPRLSQKNRESAGPRPRLGTGDGEDADAPQAGLGIFLGNFRDSIVYGEPI